MNAAVGLRRLLAWWAGALVLCALAPMLLFWRPWAQPRLMLVSPPAHAAFDGPVALSPDGARLAAAVGGGGPLEIVDLPSRRTRELAGTAGASLPFWSPDGRTLGFFAHGQLQAVDPDTGRVRSLCPAPDGRGASWSRDGTILFAPNTTGPLLRVSAAGGTPQPATALDAARGETCHRWPHFLPDGRHFLFSALAGAKDAGVACASLDAGPVRHMAAIAGGAVATDRLLLYSQGGKLLAAQFDPAACAVSGASSLVAAATGYSSRFGTRLFSAASSGHIAYQDQDPNHARALVWVDRQGNRTGTVGQPARYSLPELSPDGGSILVARATSTGSSDIWKLDAASGAASQLTAAGRHASSPIWSPDGGAYVFGVSSPSGFGLLLGRLGSGGRFDQLGSFDNVLLPTGWSRDGRTILLDSIRGGSNSWQVWAFPTAGAEKPFPLVALKDKQAFGARFSPDGGCIAFSSDESGTQEVYLMRSVAGAERRRVSAAGGAEPRWSGGGRELFYIAPGPVLMSVPVGPGPACAAATPGPLFSLAAPELNPLEYAAGFGYSPHPDGRRFLFAMRSAEPSGEVTVLRELPPGP